MQYHNLINVNNIQKLISYDVDVHQGSTWREFLREILYNNILIIAIHHS